MNKIKLVKDVEQITKVTLDVMNALPEWFSPPEDIVSKSILHRKFPFFVAYDGEKAVGFLALKIHNAYTADIYTVGVLKEYHRMGIGHKLIDAIVEYCKEYGYRFLTVKTLDESAEYEPYNATRAFYKKVGFYPLEVFTTFWDEENPCLFMVKVIGKEE